MSIFKTEPYKIFTVKTGYNNLALADVTKILVTKPDRSTYSYDATVSGTDLTFTLADTELDQDGIWKFQAYIEIDGNKRYGEIDEKRIKIPIKL